MLEKHKVKETKINKNSEIEDEFDQESDLDSETLEKNISLNKKIKELKEKLNQITHKKMEYRRQTEKLKQDLKKTQKV